MQGRAKAAPPVNEYSTVKVDACAENHRDRNISIGTGMEGVQNNLDAFGVDLEYGGEFPRACTGTMSVIDSIIMSAPTPE